MNLDQIEIWVHDHIFKNEKIRHFIYGVYQRVLYLVSSKMKYEGPIEKITPNDGFEYLFGYYDKCPWSDDGKYLLALRAQNAVSEADSTKPADIVRIDLSTKQAEKLAVTHCWNVQQGCMEQWLSNDEILYNDFRNGAYCSVVMDIKTKKERIIGLPVYDLSPDKKTALSLDFSRLHRLRPGYGYSNIPEVTKAEKCPDTTCIWKIDIDSGAVVPLLKYTDFSSFEQKESMEGAEHKVNHLMISPSGKRFMVLHRWFRNGTKYTRLVTCSIDGTDMYNLADDGFVSHCCWKNDDEILSYLEKADGGKGYYLLKDKTHAYEKCWNQLLMDGHPSYSRDGNYVVTDTYPNRKRIQSLYILNGKRIKRIAQVFSPFKYSGNTRCDLHPRWSRDGKQICIDASFDGKRSICIVNIGKEIMDSPKQAAISNQIKSASIIIPCYNCEDYIDETLDSLVSQTDQDFEVICINDGSNDGTLHRLEQWKKSGQLDLKIINQENFGVGRARNEGIKAAQGKYILFLDADDLYHEQFVERMVQSIEKTGADTVYCKHSRILDDVQSCFPCDKQIHRQTQSDAMRNLLYCMGNISFCNYIYRKQILSQELILFDEHTKYGEDREFNWKYLCHCNSIIFLDMPLYWYRTNRKSATKSKATWRKTDLLTAVKRIEEYLKEHKCPFLDEFHSYMYARAMWAVAKTFSVSRDKELFTKLKKEYPVRECMKRTAKDANKLVAIASICYLVHPFLFYAVIGMKNKG